MNASCGCVSGDLYGKQRSCSGRRYAEMNEPIFRSDCVSYQGAGIVQLILDHGKLRPPDIMCQLSTSDSKGD
jgi:hypothetical protein